MKNEHTFDPDFRFVSNSLKKAIEITSGENRNYCVDIPAGNGRNLFYLSQFFTHIKAVDINERYLGSIVDFYAKYNFANSKIITSRVDFTHELPIEVQSCDFICTIHYYSYSLLSRVIEKMKKNSYYFIETPNCNGGNFLDLPLEQEITWLLKDVTIILLETNNCRHTNTRNKNIAFKCLLRK